MEAGLVATGLALVGFAASLAMPPAPAIAPRLRIDPHIARATWRILKSAGHGQGVWMAIFGISWFFAVGAMLLSAFAPLVSGTLGSRRQVATLFLLVFSVSVALGSVLVNRLLKGEVSARYVPLSAFILGGFLVDLWLATKGFVIRVPDASIGDFIDSPGGVRIIADLAGIALAGGTFIVPLYAVLQTHGPPTERSRTIAANNIVNAAVSVAVVGSVSGMFALGASVPLVIGVMGMGTILLGLIFWRLLNGAKAAAQSGP
jgi:acyl-[acyl-carrier-protein]-phospholipid O-acyltransferase/long-chain-fatty-acid--[acyl-carrier-protein] ligase